MSAPETPPLSDPPPRGPIGVGGAVMILCGVLLLLPGACAIFSAATLLPSAFGEPGVLLMLGLLWAVCALISYGGIKLIQRGGRR